MYRMTAQFSPTGLVQRSYVINPEGCATLVPGWPQQHRLSSDLRVRILDGADQLFHPTDFRRPT